MKILFVTHRFPPSIGGMENQCYELYSGLSKSFDVELYKMPENVSHLWWLLRLGTNLKKYLSKNRNITHIYFNDGLIALAAMSLKKLFNVKTIATVHGLDVVYPAEFYQKLVIKNLKNNIDVIVSVSSATAEECIKRGIGANKVFVVPNGVDLSLKNIEFDKDFKSRLKEMNLPDITKKKTIVSVGRGVRRKGFSWFLESVIPSLDEDFFYVMIGPPQKKLFFFNLLFSFIPAKIGKLIELTGIGIDQVQIQKLLKTENISRKAVYLGKVPFKDLVQILKHSTAFIMPNIHVEGDAEGFGLVALEAVMNGTIAVVADIEGIREAIKDGKNGFLVKSADAEAWKEKLLQISVPAFKRANFIKKAAKYTEENFSWSKMVEGYIKLMK